MAVVDAELPPPMAPVVNGGPNFGSTLATSRDFRISSFKKADVDMCQASFSSNHPLSLNMIHINHFPFTRNDTPRDIPCNAPLSWRSFLLFSNITYMWIRFSRNKNKFSDYLRNEHVMPQTDKKRRNQMRKFSIRANNR